VAPDKTTVLFLFLMLCVCCCGCIHETPTETHGGGSNATLNKSYVIVEVIESPTETPLADYTFSPRI
jgi:hypothetical protein